MDPYQSPDDQSQAVIDAMVQRLEERGQNDRFDQFIHHYLDVVKVENLTTALDLGCGTGVVTRCLAKRMPEGSFITGVDVSEKLLHEAQVKSPAHIHWQHYEGARLPFEDHRFDLIVMHTLLSHVPDPVSILKESGRVLKPGGTIVVFDADYASTCYAIQDFHKGREIDTKLFTAVVHNLNVCRVMPRHIRAAGLKLLSSTAHVIAETGKGDFWLSSVKGFSKLIPALQILPEEEGQAWAAEMLESHENGTFFASGNFYTYFIQAVD